MPEKLELGPRLRAIADLVPPDCRCLADIGTDHGYVPAGPPAYIAIKNEK